jgi:hypothetical protein
MPAKRRRYTSYSFISIKNASQEGTNRVQSSLLNCIGGRMLKDKKIGDLSKQDITRLVNFDLPAIQEGIRQAELSLTDASNTKESLDKRTFFLLPVFISLPPAILTLMSLIGQQKYLSELFILLFAIFFLIAAVLLFISLWSCNYGSLGRYPSTWLNKDVIEGNNQEFGYTLTMVLYEYQERIAGSDKINARRSSLNNVAIFFSILGVIVLCVAVAIQIIKNHSF